MKFNYWLPLIAVVGLASSGKAQPLDAEHASAGNDASWQPRCLACHVRTDIPKSASSWFINSGASYYSLQPFFNNNTAYTFTTASTQNGGSTISGLTQSQQFGWTMQPAFDVWVEAIAPNGVGMRLRYFHLDGASGDAVLSVPSSQYNAANSSVIAVLPSPTLFNSPPGTVPQQNPALAGLFGGPSPFIVNFPGAPPSIDRFVFRSALRLDAIDLEATGRLSTKTLDISGGLGGRYFHMTQSYGATLTNSNAVGATLSESLDYRQTFQGGGPTVSGRMSWHPILPNLSFFAGGRGSLVVGQLDQSTSGSRIIKDPTGAFNPIGTPTNISNTFSIPTSSLNAIPIAELELGVEYAIFLKRSTAIIRAAAVDQTYFGVGNASGSNGNLGLLGFKITTGLTF